MAVVTCLNVIPSLRLFPPHAAPKALGAPGTRPPVGELVEQVRAEVDGHGTVLVVAPHRDAGDLAHDVCIVRSILGPDRVVVVQTKLPPLATAVLASHLAAAADKLQGTGQVLAAVAALQRWLTALAWLRRVDKLEYPDPGLRLHAWSLLPGTRFVASAHPKPFVHRIGAGDPLPGLRKTPGPWLAVLSPPGNGSSWLREVADTRMGAQRVVEVNPPPLSARWWGSRRVAELVVCPDALSTVTDWITSERPVSPCPWCGVPVNGTECPVCSMVRDAPAAAGSAPTAAGGAR